MEFEEEDPLIAFQRLISRPLMEITIIKADKGDDDLHPITLEIWLGDDRDSDAAIGKGKCP